MYNGIKRLFFAVVHVVLLSLFWIPLPGGVKAAPTVESEYREYQKRFEAMHTVEDIEAAGFVVEKEQKFPVYLEQFGEVMFLPAIDKQCKRMALFFADSEGNITYKTDQLEANFQKRGSVKQQVTGLSAVSFQDMNADGLWDIVLISECEKESAAKGSAEKETENTAENIVGNDRNYRVGDVLFQGKKCFYRDWRVSDKVNRFGMNKSIKVIAAYVRDGYSTEFMYTAATMDELLQNGLHVVSEQCYWRTFEKLGRLMVVPGTYRIADYEVFMIYLVNEQGNIVWSCQPMEDYDSLYALKGINCRDIDGDGLKDLVVLARYSKEWNGSGVSTQTDYAVYYQRVSGFTEDKEIKEQYICREDETMTELVRAARAYWGWSTEDD